MKERVLVKYQYQNDPHDKTFNCFFMLKDSNKPLRVLDIIAEFPGYKLREYGDKGFHFRFQDKLGKINCWVDIKNLSAAVPINKNIVEMKVLIMPSQSDSLIFHNIAHDLERRDAKLARELQDEEERDYQRAQAASQPKPAPRAELSQKVADKRETQKMASVDLISGDIEMDFGISKSAPKPANSVSQSTPLPKAHHSDDFDILGGDHHTAPVDDFESNGNQDQKMNEMFGEDFHIDPNSTNRVLDVIYIQEKQKENTKKNIEAIENKNKKIVEIQDAKLQAGQVLEPKVQAWATASNGSKNNVRILLTTLHQILWEGADIEPISMADLITDNNVKRQYMKAIMKVHPDQNSEVTDPSVLYLMDRVFNILNDSYTEFNRTKK